MIRSTTTCVTIAVFAVCLMIIAPGVRAQDGAHESEREVIVMFKPQVLKLPQGIVSGSVEELLEVTPQVRALLEQFNVDRVRKAFPEISPADTLIVTKQKRTIRTQDRSRVFVLRLANGQRRAELIDRLNDRSEVIYAEPNALARVRGHVSVAPMLIPYVHPVVPTQVTTTPNDTYFSDQWSLQNTEQAGGTA